MKNIRFSSKHIHHPQPSIYTIRTCYIYDMQNRRSSSKEYLYISLGLFAVPVAIAGSTLLNVDESGLGTTLIFFFVGLPSIIIGAIFAILSFANARKEEPNHKVDTKIRKVIKIILGSIIFIMLSLPVLYVLNVIRVLVFG